MSSCGVCSSCHVCYDGGERRAKLLGNLVLKPKKYLKTRFVRSLVLGLRCGLQNLPTMIQISAQDYECAALEGRNTEAKMISKLLTSMRSSPNLVKLVSVLQPLEIYCKTSLTAQSSQNFPSEVWLSIISSQEKLSHLSS